MTAILYLIPISIALGLIFLWAFFWSVKVGQYNDLEGDAYRMLVAEDEPLDDAQRAALRDDQT